MEKKTSHGFYKLGTKVVGSPCRVKQVENRIRAEAWAFLGLKFFCWKSLYFFSNLVFFHSLFRWFNGAKWKIGFTSIGQGWKISLALWILWKTILWQDHNRRYCSGGQPCLFPLPGTQLGKPNCKYSNTLKYLITVFPISTAKSIGVIPLMCWAIKLILKDLNWFKRISLWFEWSFGHWKR